MAAMSSWVNEHAPSWIVKEGDPRGTAVRMALVMLSLAPSLGIVAFL